MDERPLLELWAPPDGYRLASILATTYELEPDFFEEDVLPVALNLRTPPARGRDFRIELERALQDVEVTILYHPARYRPGLRRTPRVDLVALPEVRYPKLHSKVSLLRFVSNSSPEPEAQAIHLIVGSSNLTVAGYRTNLEVTARLEDTPAATRASATAVRDAVQWLRGLLGHGVTEQVQRQLRELEAVSVARPIREDRTKLRFIGLPRSGGLPQAFSERKGKTANRLTVVSPFWPTGREPDDVVQELCKACGGVPQAVRLVGPAVEDDDGRIWPVMPPTLVGAFLAAGSRVDVASANPRHGCDSEQDQEEDEVEGVPMTRTVAAQSQRELHAKILLVEHRETAQLAIGSFNLTRRGLGLRGDANAEAGLIWELPVDDLNRLQLLSFATNWKRVARSPQREVKAPEKVEGSGTGEVWPAFLVTVRAQREALELVVVREGWPGRVTVTMRDIRGRLVPGGEDRWFDPWVVDSIPEGDGPFVLQTALAAGWMERAAPRVAEQPALPDLEATLVWKGGRATVPVIFVEKHLFPIVESRTRNDERALIEWFLGLRRADDAEGAGFGHGIEPLDVETSKSSSSTEDILSYLVRDFVHALPGIRARLAESALTETGLKTALLGPRSPVELGKEILRSLRNRGAGRPRKTVIATAFQLRELLDLLRSVSLPELPNGATERLREGALKELYQLFAQVEPQLPRDCAVLTQFLASGGR